MPLKMKKLFLILLAALLLFGSGCGAKTRPAAYTLTLSGQLTEAGVIRYADLEMNVYEDAASNPCGECAFQPQSVLKGDDAKTVIAAMAAALGQSDSGWRVQSNTDTEIVLAEKTPGGAERPERPETPAGLVIEGTYTPAK